MAHATYDASNNRFRGTQGVTANNDYVCYNNTQTGLHVTLDHDSDVAGIDFDITLGPGEGNVFRPQHGGTVTFTGVPLHTAVLATTAVSHVNMDGDALNGGSASLVFTPF